MNNAKYKIVDSKTKESIEYSNTDSTVISWIFNHSMINNNDIIFYYYDSFSNEYLPFSTSNQLYKSIYENMINLLNAFYEIWMVE